MKNFRHIVRVSKSQIGIFAQLIGVSGDTIIGKRYNFPHSKKVAPVIQSSEAGRDFAKLVLAKKVKEITFDRNGNIYRGRIKSFAEGMREQGLVF
jgi:large subunit ribosomal protein L18